MDEKNGKAGKTSTDKWGLCPMENISATIQSIDTVRTLHQTIVALRTALEEAKLEIQRLRSQLSAQTDIKESAKPQDTLTEPISSKVTEDETEQASPQVTIDSEQIIEKHAPTFETISEEKRFPDEPINNRSFSIIERVEHVETFQSLELPENSELASLTSAIDSIPQSKTQQPRISFVPDIRVTARRKMASKIDVKIKVLSNIKIKSTSSTDTSGTSPPSSARSDKSGKSSILHSEQAATTANRTEQPDDTKDQSASGSDNSVFLDDKPAAEAPAVVEKTTMRTHDSKEEVDDIELIFSSDENREPIQEDLVSISEYDPWQPTGASGTPVLVKFSSVQSDQEERLTSVPKKISASTSHDAVYMANMSQQKSQESSDSLEGQRSLKSSSLENETSSGDQKDQSHSSMGRDESMDFFDQKDSSFGRKWTNYNVIVETDISKCGIIEETTFEMYRRNTCPNPPAYRPLMQRDIVTSTTRHTPVIGSKYPRRTCGVASAGTQFQSPKTGASGTKRSSAAQTEITALPEHWKSESQLVDSHFHAGGPFTLPSKCGPSVMATGYHRHVVRNDDRTQEARRVLLSDINFTSMVPELSRSADHLCPEKVAQSTNKSSTRYYKGSHLKTPDYALKGMTPSASMTSPGVSQWTVNENSLGTQTTQTVESWGKRGDSLDSCRSYSVGSRFSGLDRSHRSRSVPSIRCAVCKLAHGIRTSESMHYTPRVTFQEPASKIRGSLPDLRHQCACTKRYPGRSIFTIHGDSSGSTESLLDEADNFVRNSLENAYLSEDVTAKKPNFRRMSENDIQKDYVPSKQSLPFLPKTAKCLKPGHLAKVISKNGRVVVGRVRYVGPLATLDKSGCTVIEDLYVGVQLQSKCGDCDGTFEGRKFFDCEPLQGLFVPFKKVVMAWSG